MSLKLVKSFTREFPLIHVQMWGKRYASIFLDVNLPHAPIYVHLLKNGLVTAYRNPCGQADVVNPILRSKLDEDPRFINSIVEEKKEVLVRLVEINKKNKVSLEEFQKYLVDLFDYWQIHYISQFLPLDELRFSKRERDEALLLRKNVEKVIHDSWDSINLILKKIYPDLKEFVRYISWDEVFNFQKPNISELQRRDTEGVFVYNGDIVSESGLKGIQERECFEIEWDSDVVGEKEVSGQIACKGKVTGNVRIILKTEDLPRFIEGEILVSYMTMPAFISAMKKAAGFVTDEGGITCHAAIVARELKKPCIIGTKIATKVLKDGDLVEVDANTGVVKILKKSK